MGRGYFSKFLNEPMRRESDSVGGVGGGNTVSKIPCPLRESTCVSLNKSCHSNLVQ